MVIFHSYVNVCQRVIYPTFWFFSISIGHHCAQGAEAEGSEAQFALTETDLLFLRQVGVLGSSRGLRITVGSL